MLRVLLVSITISISLLFISCSDSATGPDSPGEGDEEQQEEVEPSASLSNPDDGTTLEGDIVYSIEGEAPDGFEEARIYVGEDVYKTVESPSLPYEDTLETYTVENGQYQMKVEFDVSGADTTVSDSVSVTFENYLLELETEGYISYLNQIEELESEYLIISDPQGNVLRMMDMTEMSSDGQFQLLPPGAFEEEAPSRFYVSTGTYYTRTDYRDSFSLETMIGFESWSSEIYRYGPQEGSDNSEPARQEVTFTFKNHKYPPRYSFADNPNYPNTLLYLPFDGTISQRTTEIDADAEDLMMTTWPENHSNPPQYYWEHSVQDSIENSGTFTYNVAGNESFEGFKPMDVADVELPSGVSVDNYWVGMTAAEESWDEGLFTFYSYSGSRDGNSDNSTLGMYTVISDTSTHYYDVNISAQNSSEDTFYRQQTYGELPTEVATVEGDIQLENRNMDDLQLSVTGSFDHGSVYARYTTDQYTQNWRVYLPDTAESFVYPKIADSLGNEVSSYDRSSFELAFYDLYDYEEQDSYSGLLTQAFGIESDRVTSRQGYLIKSKSLTSSQGKYFPHSTERGIKPGEQLPPVSLSDQKAKVNETMPVYNGRE